MDDFDNKLVNIKLYENYIRIIPKNVKFDKETLEESLHYLDDAFKEYNIIFENDNNKTIEMNFDTTNISAFESYKFAKHLEPFFKERQEFTERFIVKTYIISNNMFIRAIINSILKFYNLSRPILIVKSLDEII